jgi:OFA family oxalate/formate antiporter-like MFS transporter
MENQVKNKGWTVTFSGTGINLALGVLYAWSVVQAAITKEVSAGNWDWESTSIRDPYSVALVVFAFAMVPAGRMLDKWGPRLTSSIGGLLVGAGFIIASMSSSYWAWIIGFGVLAGTGIGMSYASATPAAVKWFPAKRTGLVTGLVVGGFGLASAYIAPLATFMQNTLGITQTMLYLGITFLIVVVVLSQLLISPPAGYVPGDTPAPKNETAATAGPAKADWTWKEMMATPTFWLLWLTFAIGAGAGLMVIGAAAKMAKLSLGDMAWLAVTVLAIGNASGRVIAGILSDKIGRKASLTLFMMFQAALIFGFIFLPKDSAMVVVLVATFIGFNYGTNLTLFPSATKDLYGSKNLGLNYGIVFTAWGVGGAILSRISIYLEESSGSWDNSCIMAGSLLVFGAIATLFLRAPKPKKTSAPIGQTASADS